MPYVVGYNTPGYLPESYPYICEDADSAKRALIDDMLRHADSADMGHSFNLGNELAFATEDLNLSDVSQGYGITICDPNREHNLGTHYWIEIAEDCCADPDIYETTLGTRCNSCGENTYSDSY